MTDVSNEQVIEAARRVLIASRVTYHITDERYEVGFITDDGRDFGSLIVTEDEVNAVQESPEHDHDNCNACDALEEAAQDRGFEAGKSSAQALQPFDVQELAIFLTTWAQAHPSFTHRQQAQVIAEYYAAPERKHCTVKQASHIISKLQDRFCQDRFYTANELAIAINEVLCIEQSALDEADKIRRERGEAR